MKALFTFIFLSFFNLNAAFAQATDTLEVSKFQPYFTAGAKCGVNVSSLHNFNNNSSRLGLMLGLSGEYRFSRLLGLAIEINYSQHGSTSTQVIKHGYYGNTFQEIEYGLNYITLPVLLTLHDNNFTVQAGAYGAVLLKAKAQNGKISEDNTKHFAQTETGLCVGLAYHFWGNTVLGMRYYRGLQNLNKSIPNTHESLWNSTLQVTGGYTF